jgi:hypothetical protein
MPLLGTWGTVERLNPPGMGLRGREEGTWGTWGGAEGRGADEGRACTIDAGKRGMLPGLDPGGGAAGAAAAADRRAKVVRARKRYRNITLPPLFDGLASRR